MADTKIKIKKDDNIAENTSKKKKTIMICVISVAVILIVSLVLFLTLYLIPYNKEKEKYNTAIEQFNAEVTALEGRNTELDDSIESLHKVINAENIPVDEYVRYENLLTEAQDAWYRARENDDFDEITIHVGSAQNGQLWRHTCKG